ncbi:MAG: hypothetical protein WCS37_02735 [Chloroflexota bacterium]|nr:hypothetical protein [Chloroflexota bacterium]
MANIIWVYLIVFCLLLIILIITGWWIYALLFFALFWTIIGIDYFVNWLVKKRRHKAEMQRRNDETTKRIELGKQTLQLERDATLVKVKKIT